MTNPNEPGLPMGLTEPQYEMYLKMMINRGEKTDGYRVHLLDKWFSLRRLKCPAIIGTFSLTSTQTKQRWMLKNESYEFEGIRCTPTDLARSYLQVKYGGQKRRITSKQWQEFYNVRRSAPVFAKPQTIESAVYVDLQSAYWSILSACGWDADYMPGCWLKKKTGVLDFPFAGVKMARNCLVSVAANETGAMRVWTGQSIIVKRTGNALVNRMLWSLVMDVLNGVASECIEAGAAYCYTDGFICESSLAQTLMSIIGSWGLSGAIKHRGEAHIKGAGSYRIGEKRTVKYHLQRERAFDRVDRGVNVPFLKPRFKFFADNASNFSEWR